MLGWGTAPPLAVVDEASTTAAWHYRLLGTTESRLISKAGHQALACGAAQSATASVDLTGGRKVQFLGFSGSESLEYLLHYAICGVGITGYYLQPMLFEDR
eukprot:38675-Pleurochrysis_carterae.AAC.2